MGLSYQVLNVKTRKEYYYEHFGMMDDPSYAEAAVQKLASYAKHGFFPGQNLLVSFETQKQVLNPDLIQKMLRPI